VLSGLGLFACGGGGGVACPVVVTSTPTSPRDLGLAVCGGGAGLLAGLGGGVEGAVVLSGCTGKVVSLASSIATVSTSVTSSIISSLSGDVSSVVVG
jgi:hypothetical protein